MKKRLKSSRSLSLVLMALIAVGMILCSAVAVYSAEFFTAKADSNTVVSHRSETSFLGITLPLIATATADEIDTLATDTLIPFRVTRMADGVSSPVPLNDNTLNLREQMNVYSGVVYINVTAESYEGEAILQPGTRYTYNVVLTDRHYCNAEKLRVYYISGGTETDLSITTNASNNQIYFVVPNDIPEDAEIVINSPYITMPDAHKITVGRAHNLLSLTLTTTHADRNNRLYATPTAISGSKSITYSYTTVSTDPTFRELTYAQEGCDITITSMDMNNIGAYTVKDIKVYTPDAEGNYTVERSDLISLTESGYVFTMPDEDVFLDVDIEHHLNKLEISVTSPDNSLSTISLLRANAGATNTYTAARYIFKTPGVYDNSYYYSRATGTNPQEVSLYSSSTWGANYYCLIALAGSYGNTNAANAINSHRISNVKVEKIDADGNVIEDITDSAELELSVINKTSSQGRYGLLMKPIDADIRVSCEFTIADNYHIYVKETSSPDGTRIGSYLSGLKVNYSDTSISSISSVSSMGNDGRTPDTPVDYGLFLADSEMKYSLRTNSWNYYNMVPWKTLKSFKIYETDENGNIKQNEDGTPVELTDLLTLPDEPTTMSYGLSYFNNAVFTMPHKHILISFEANDCTIPVRVEQYIISQDGSMTPAGSDFTVNFTGEPREGNEKAFDKGNSFTAVSADENHYELVSYLGTKNISFTPAPAKGYQVSGIGYYFDDGYNSGNFWEGMGNTNYAYTTTAYITYSDGAYVFRGSFNRYNRHRIVILYSEASEVSVVQKTAGIVLDDNTSTLSTVTIERDDNNSEFASYSPFWTDADALTNMGVNGQTLNFYEYVYMYLKTQEQTNKFYAVPGTKLKLSIRPDNNRIVSDIRVYRTDGETETPVTVTRLENSSYTNAMYTLDETIPSGENVRIEIDYAIADKLKVSILLKDSKNYNQTYPNTIGATAVITGSDAATEKAFMSDAGGDPFDSFDVGADPVMVATVGNTKLNIKVNLPENCGYVIANIDTIQLNSNSHASGLTPKSLQNDEYGECRDFSECTFTMPGGNIHIRIILAKTVNVNVKLRSRGNNSDDEFVPNTVEKAFINFDNSNNIYGQVAYPIIVENQYNVAAFTVTKEPNERTVNMLEGSSLRGKISLPRGYTIASVHTVRTNNDTGEQSTVNYGFSNYKFTSDAGFSIYELQFSLSSLLNSDSSYEVVVNIEKTTDIKFNSYHSSDDGFVSNLNKSSCKATLFGARESDDPAYASSKPFGSGANANESAKAMVDRMETHYSKSSYHYYALRDSKVWLTATPVDGEVVADVKVYYANDKTLLPVTLQGIDENGMYTYTIDAKTKMGDTMIVDVYFSADLSGKITIINREVGGGTLNQNANTSFRATNNAYEKPVYDSNTGAFYASVTAGDGSTTYMVMTNSTGYVNVNASPGYIIEDTKIKYTQDEEFLNRASNTGRYNKYYHIGASSFSSDKHVFVQNTFRPAANFTLSQYVDYKGNTKDSFDHAGRVIITGTNDDPSLTDGSLYMGYKYYESYNTIENKGYFANETFRVAEGTSLTMELTEHDGYLIDYIMIYKDGELVEKVTKDDLTVSEGVYTYKFASPTEQSVNKGYAVDVHYTAESIYVMQKCLNGQNNAGCVGDVFVVDKGYDDGDDINDLSVDDVTTVNGYIGVQNGSKPLLRIVPSSSHRIVEIWYGDSASTMQAYDIGRELQYGETYNFTLFTHEAVTSAKYIKVFYEMLIAPDDPYVLPVVPVNHGLLTVNIYQEDANGFSLSTAHSATLTWKEGSTDYFQIYENSTFSDLLDNQLSLPRNNSATATICYNSSRMPIDITAKAADTYRLEKVLLTNLSTGENEVIAVGNINGSIYEYSGKKTIPAGNFALNLYFSHPIVELGTNNTLDEHKGSVLVNGEVAIAENEYMKAIKFLSGSNLTMTIQPQEDYEFSYILAGSTRNNMTLVPDSQITKNDDGTVTVDFKQKNTDVYVHVQFNSIVETDYSSLSVTHHKPDESGNYVKSTEGKVHVYGSHSFITTPILIGKAVVDSFDLTTEGSVSVNVNESTNLQFSVTPPENYTVNELTALAIDATGVTHDVAFTRSGNTFVLSEPVSANSSMLVDVYYAPGYNIIYHGNGNTTGNVPKDDTVYYKDQAATIMDKGTMARDNYTFLGWSHMNGSTAPDYVAGDTITFSDGDINLLAVWKENDKYTIVYDGNGNTGGTAPIDADNPYYVGQEATVFGQGSLTKDNYTFLGWSTDSNANSADYQEGDVIAMSSDVTLYAVWKENAKYTITYKDSLDSAADVTEEYYENGVAKVKSIEEVGFVHDEYDFKGWLVDKQGYPTEAGNEFTVTESVTYTADWQAKSYAVEYYDKDGANKLDSTLYTFKDVVNVGDGITAPVIKGETHTGWELMDSGAQNDADGTAIGTRETFPMPADTVKYKAVYSKLPYTVEYQITSVIPDGYTVPVDTNTYHYNDEVTVAPLPTGYDTARYNFSGWSCDDAVIADGKFNMPDVAGYKVIIKGTFTENNKVNLTYDPNGGAPTDAVPAQESAYTKLDTTAKSPADGFGKAGYAFAGWNTKSDGTGTSYAVGDAVSITADTTLYAQWNISSFNVEYYEADGTTCIDSQNYSYRSTVNVGDGITAPDITGKVFSEWKLIDTAQTDADGVEIGTRATFPMPAVTVKYKAVYTSLEYTVEYVVTGSMPNGYIAPVDANIYHYNDEVTVAPLPTGYDTARYNFSGWSCDDADITSGKFNMPDVKNRKVTITGVFSENGKVNLTYHPNGGMPTDAVPAQESAYTKLDTTVKAPADGFGKVGYAFAGWNTKSDGTGTSYAVGNAVSITEDTTLYAQWNISSFKVEYYEADGTTRIGLQNYSYRSTVNVGEGVNAPDITGKLFSDWKLIDTAQTDADGVEIGTRATFPMPAVTVKYKAVYTDIIYTVTYAVTGNVPEGYTAPSDSGTYRYGDTVNVFAAPTADGYSFKGWTLDDVDYAAGTANETFTITGNVTLTGVWTKNDPPIPDKVTITYQSGIDTDDASDPLAKKYTFEVTLGEDYTVLDNIWYEREGYTFRNWLVVENEVTGISVVDTLFSLFTGRANVGETLNGGDVIADLNDSITLKAQWDPIEYHITYDGNGATGGVVPTDDNAYLHNEQAVVKDKGSLVKDGFEFVEWNTDSLGNGTSYDPNDTISMTSDLKLYAIWREIPPPSKYKVTYNKNGATSGTVPKDDTDYLGGENVTVKAKGDLERTDLKFKEWNTQADGKGTSYNPDDVFTMPESDVTLYAIWIDDGGNIVSPGTGENNLGIIIAVNAMIVSFAAGIAVVVLMQRKKRRYA